MNQSVSIEVIELENFGAKTSPEMAPAPQPHTCHAVFCSFFFDDSKQDSSTTAAHIKRIIELLNKHSIMSD